MWCFRVEKDFISETKDPRLGIYSDNEYSSHGASFEFVQKYHNNLVLSNGSTSTFELYDDDRVKYFEGTITGDFMGFEPLDYFGLSFGCTMCKINGVWL